MFKDLKEVWDWSKQELLLLESNEAATAMNMLLYRYDGAGDLESQFGGVGRS